MVTVYSADSALKDYYLDAVTEALNLKASPLLAQFERTANNVVGKEVCRSVRYGVGGGICAGGEDGELPAAVDAERFQLVCSLKNLYGTIEISDKAIRASATNEGAFVNLLNDEMQALVQNAKFNFGRMLYNDYLQSIADVVSYMGDRKFKVTNAKGFVEGMLIDFLNESYLPYEGATACRVLAVDVVNDTITIERPSVGNIVEAGAHIGLQSSHAYEITGLEELFGEGVIYGHNRSESGFFVPTVKKDVGEITEAIVQNEIDGVEERTGVKTNFIVCSWGVKRALVNHFREQGILLPTMEVAGGHKALNFNGIPIVVDRFCPKGTMYLLNTDDFKIHQLCDWKWLEGEDGKILKQIPGRPVYTATLVKYANLMCDRPHAQVKLSGITEA